MNCKPRMRVRENELTQEYQVTTSMNRAERRTLVGRLRIAEARIKDLEKENGNLKAELWSLKQC